MPSLKTILLYLLFFISFPVIAQKTGRIYGQLADTVTRQVLKDAYITILKGDAVQKSVFSNATGEFSCDHLPFGAYMVHISFQGLAPVRRGITVNDTALNMGTIYMFLSVKTLDTIVVAEQPMVMNKDTIEYNASRFPTKPYATLSTLVQLLPGIQMNNDGTMTINGITIDQLTVDGEPFFTGDKEMALTHLPAEIVKKIQVYATDSLSKLVNGPKTLNIVLQADKRKGTFGKGGAGMGTADTYTVNGDINRMNGAQQYSVMGDLGNVEKERTGMDAMPQSSGSGRQRIINGGATYRDNRNKKINFSGNYLTMNMRNESTTRSHALNIYPGDSSTIQDRVSGGVMNSNNHQFNGMLSIGRGHKTLLNISPNFSINKSGNTFTQQASQQFEKTGEQTYQTAGSNSSNNTGTSIGTNIHFVHNFKRPAERLFSIMNIRNNDNTSASTNNSETKYATYTNDIHQQNKSNSHTLTINSNTSYSVPLRNSFSLQAQGGYTFNKDNNRYRTLKYNNATGHFDQLDTTQSNTYGSTYHTGTLQVGISKMIGQVNVSAGAGIESDWLHGENETNHTSLSKRYLNMLPQVSINYNPASGQALQVSYTGKPNQMTIQQLQPVTMTTDSLYIQEGNPDLQQPYAHSINLSYSMMKDMRMVTVALSSGFVNHSIGAATTLLSNGARVTKPVNLEGQQNIGLMVNCALPPKTGKSGFNISGNVFYSKNPVLSNGVRNDSRNVYFNSTFSWTYHDKKGLNVILGVSPGYNFMSTDIGLNTSYFNAGVNGRADYSWRDWEGGLAVYYNYSSSLPASYQPDFPFLSPTLRYRFLKRKQAQVSVSVKDLLNQQSGASRSVGVTSVVDTWTQTRGRYAMLSFTYNISRFGGGSSQGKF
ncbi:TonB-dependent receptor [Chitinophaga sp.]|uniref:TonB-dependent receptor n=1 Tax=Chitinophaga sp. TaxID=1869181 RepID=UPI0031D85791